MHAAQAAARLGVLAVAMFAMASTPVASADDDERPPPRIALRVGIWDDAGWHHAGLYQGDQEVDVEQFLRTAGRQDVIDRFHRRYWLRVGLVVGGVVAGLGGLAYAVTRDSCDGLTNQVGPGDDLGACRDERAQRGLIGTLIAFTGGGLVIGGVVASDLRPGRAALRAIARTHNQRGDTAATDVVIAPTLSPRGAGVMVALSF